MECLINRFQNTDGVFKITVGQTLGKLVQYLPVKYQRQDPFASVIKRQSIVMIKQLLQCSQRIRIGETDGSDPVYDPSNRAECIHFFSGMGGHKNIEILVTSIVGKTGWCRTGEDQDLALIIFKSLKILITDKQAAQASGQGLLAGFNAAHRSGIAHNEHSKPLGQI